MIASLARPAFAGLARTPRAWLPILAWAAVAVALALAGRADDPSGAAERVLPGPLGGFVVPLLAFAMVGGLLAGRTLRDATAPVVAFGAPPVRAAAVVVGVAVGACAASCAAVSVVALVLAHGPTDVPLFHDLLATASACAWGGAAYGALFAFGGTLGRRGIGRPLLLVADWVVGRGTGVVALLAPRAHLRNLLAGAGPVELPPLASTAAMAGFVLLFAALAVRRGR